MPHARAGFVKIASQYSIVMTDSLFGARRLGHPGVVRRLIKRLVNIVCHSGVLRLLRKASEMLRRLTARLCYIMPW